MKYAVTALALVAFASGAEARATKCAAVDKPMVEAQFDRFNQGLASKSPDRMTALFAHDAVLPTLSGEERITPAEIRAYFVDFLKKSPVGHIDTSNVRLGCNTASRKGNWTFTLTDPATHKKSVAHARYTFIYTHEPEGWMIAHLHSSVMPAGH